LTEVGNDLIYLIYSYSGQKFIIDYLNPHLKEMSYNSRNTNFEFMNLMK